MDVKTIIFLVMFGIGLLFVGLGVWKNRKNHWIYAVTRAAVVLLSVAIGILCSNLLGGLLGSLLGVRMGAAWLFGNTADLFEAMPALEEAIAGLFGCVFSLLLFVGIFFIVKAILNAIAKPVARAIIRSVSRKAAGKNDCAVEEAGTALKGKEKKKFKKNVLRTPRANLWGMLCGGLMCLLVWVALFAPFVGIAVVVDDGLSILAPTDEGDDGMATVVEVVDAVANNAGSKTVYYLGGKPISDALLTCTVGGHSVNLGREISFFSAAGDAFSYLSEDGADKALAAEKIRGVGDKFSNTDLLPVLIPEFCGSACEQWDKGEEFMGLASPSDGEEDSFLSPVLEVLSDSTYDTVKEDVPTLFGLIAEAVEADAWESIENDPIQLFQNTEFSTSMLKTLLGNGRLDGLVGVFLQIGIESMGDGFGASSAHLDQIELDSDRVADADKEAVDLAAAFSAVADLVKSDDFVAADSIRSLGNVLDLLKVTETVGSQNVEHLVMAMLESENFMDSMGISSLEAVEIAESVIDGAKKQSYGQVMASMSDTIRVLEAANGETSVKESVNTLMKSLDTTSAKVLGAMAKPGAMIANGVPEENAEASANMMSSMFTNLSVMGEDMTREEFEAEANAVSHLTNLAMNASLNEGDSVFGEEGAMGISEADFVNETLGSSVAAKTIRDAVYADGQTTPKKDPLGTEMELSAEEESEILRSLNERWASESDTQNEETRQNYIAFGAVMNMELTITESGIQKMQ